MTFLMNKGKPDIGQESLDETPVTESGEEGIETDEKVMEEEVIEAEETTAETAIKELSEGLNTRVSRKNKFIWRRKRTGE